MGQSCGGFLGGLPKSSLFPARTCHGRHSGSYSDPDKGVGLSWSCIPCTLSTGPRAGDYTYREGLEHKCKRDVLLGRLRSSEDQIWKRIRPRPTKTSFVGSYYLCKGEWTIVGLVPARSSSSQAYSRMATGEGEGAQIKPWAHLRVSLSSLGLVQRQRSLRMSCGPGAM